MNIEIADRLVKLRKAHNLSQEELASKLGISRQAVSKWERAEASPDTDNLITLAKLYNVSLDELLFTEEDEIDLKDKEDSENYRPNNDGIQIRKGDKQITVDDDLIRITLNESNNSYNIKRTYNWDRFPYPILMVIVFFILGFGWDLWDIGWLAFLTIPLYYSLGVAIRRRNLNSFAFPVLAAIIYLFTGLMWGWWSYGWIIFLAIPLYYGIASMFKK